MVFLRKSKMQKAQSGEGGVTEDEEQRNQEHQKFMGSLEAKLFSVIEQVSSLETRVRVSMRGDSDAGSSPRLWRSSAGSEQAGATEQELLSKVSSAPAGQWEIALSGLKLRGSFPTISPVGVSFPRPRRFLLPLVPFLALRVDPHKGGIELCLEAADADEFESMITSGPKWPLLEQNNSYKFKAKLSRLRCDLFGDDDDDDSDISLELKSIVVTGPLLPLVFFSQKYLGKYSIKKVPLDWFPDLIHPAAVAQRLCDEQGQGSGDTFDEDERRKLKVKGRKFARVNKYCCWFFLAMNITILSLLTQIKKVVVSNFLGAQHGASAVIHLETTIIICDNTFLAQSAFELQNFCYTNEARSEEPPRQHPGHFPFQSTRIRCWFARWN